MIVSELVARLQALPNQAAHVLVDVTAWDRPAGMVEVSGYQTTPNGQLVLQPSTGPATRLDTGEQP